MNHLHNEPAGANFDPRNPENVSDDLCVFCDKQRIKELWWEEKERLVEEMKDEDGDLTAEQCKEIDVKEQEFKGQFGECRGCNMDNL